MRYITIPQDVTIRIKNLQVTNGPPIADTTETKSFLGTLEDVWLNHPEIFGKTASAIRASVKISNLFQGKKAGDVVVVDESDFEKLDQAVETSSYNPVVVRQIVSFLDAVHNAPSVAPGPGPGANGPSGV